MSVNYASGLSSYSEKGVCGLPEIHDDKLLLSQKIDKLAELFRASSYTVVHTGAGISTSCGIPDFRGPNGVWTLEKSGRQPNFAVQFEDAVPSAGHIALVALEQAGFVNYLITQNVDGLHLRSGFPRNRISILHGDMFTETCRSCHSYYIRSSTTVPTIGLKPTGFICRKQKTRSRYCGTSLTDTVLDWDDELPEPDFSVAVNESSKAQLSIAFGTSLQIFPAANLPFLSKSEFLKKSKRKTSIKHENFIRKPTVSIVNLQSTKMDHLADLCIHATTDQVLTELCSRLNVKVASPEKATKKYVPGVLLRSSHSSASDELAWDVHSHPANTTSPFMHL